MENIKKKFKNFHEFFWLVDFYLYLLVRCEKLDQIHNFISYLFFLILHGVVVLFVVVVVRTKLIFYFSVKMISRKFVCGSLYKELFLMNLRPCIFNKIIYEHWPGSLLVIIRHIIIDRQAKIKQEVPSILRYGPFMILLKNKNIFFT